MKFLTEGPAGLARDARDRGIEAEACLDRDRKQVEGVGQRALDRLLTGAGLRTQDPLRHVPAHEHAEQADDEGAER